MKKNKPPKTINFETASHGDLDYYGMVMLISGSPELSSVLRGHLLIERAIEALLAKNLKFPKKFFDAYRVTFEMKVDLADAMGLMPTSYVTAAKALNKIRNKYAHDEEYRLSVEELNSLKISWTTDQKLAYEQAVTEGTEVAVKFAVIFLNWSFLKLLHPNATSSDPSDPLLWL